MKCPAVKILYHHIAGLRLQVHTGGCYVAARLKFFRVGDINFGGVTGKFRLRSGKFKSSCLADNTTCAIAANQPLSIERVVASLNNYAIISLSKVCNGNPALNYYPKGLRAAGKYGFKFLYFGN